ncbi:MAG TPA: sigma-54 dependent transcriptional regulator [bacterium]
MTEATILVVDDEPAQRALLADFLRDEGYRVAEAADGAAALARVRNGGIDLLLTDVRMPGISGEELLCTVREESPHLPVLLITAHDTVEQAVTAMQSGAFSYIAKPVNLDGLLAQVERALEHRRLAEEVEALRSAAGRTPDVPDVVAESPAMRAVLSEAARVAPRRATVLITGESGTGKEVVARAIHALSGRVGAPFVAVNCAALPESLLESELFGHETGAFTGAVRRHTGRFEQAHGGTLFLDEIGDLPGAVQVKLLRALQERTIERLGGSEPIAVDVRLIAATHRDLQAAIRDGSFREDLYYRLNVVALHLPPLRSRRPDIPPLIDHLLERINRENDTGVTGVSREVLEAFLRYPWPGNVRELRNVLERAVVLNRGRVIHLGDLPAAFRAPPEKAPIAGGSLVENERATIISALQAAGWNRSIAADRLGIHRNTLRRKIRELGIAPPVDG